MIYATAVHKAGRITVEGLEGRHEYITTYVAVPLQDPSANDGRRKPIDEITCYKVIATSCSVSGSSFVSMLPFHSFHSTVSPLVFVFLIAVSFRNGCGSAESSVTMPTT